MIIGFLYEYLNKVMIIYNETIYIYIYNKLKHKKNGLKSLRWDVILYKEFFQYNKINIWIWRINIIGKYL